ncbi:MAG: aminomethyltransferase family protein [Candidatus Cloacimonetes bacterium]|nr:aminomethyltransferase family protein [Candidatus Cloacimonadota bacterium]
MKKHGFEFPPSPRQTYLFDIEESWYLDMLSDKLGISDPAIKRSNFGEYDMAVNYGTSVLQEAVAINRVAVYNIDHMAQIRFQGKDAAALLNRTLTANIAEMKIGQCKYSLLLNEKGGVQDDMIAMMIASDEFIVVVNAGHDITDKALVEGKQLYLIADIDRIMSCIQSGEEVCAVDVSDQYVKVDVQGPLSMKLIRSIYGGNVLKNRYQADKNMNYFTFNEFDHEDGHYLISRTGYTNRWGWEIYIPIPNADKDFKLIVGKALDLGGLLVGLGGRDENRLSAGAYGLPLMGHEYDPEHTPVNAPLFAAAVDLDKEYFVGKKAILDDLNSPKQMVFLITEGIVSGRGVYLDGKRLGSVTSSMNSPNVSREQRLAIGSKRKNVTEEHGIAAIGIGWLYQSPFEKDGAGNDLTVVNDKPMRIPVEFYRESEDGKPVGNPVIGYITAEGISPATAPKPLNNIAIF